MFDFVMTEDEVALIKLTDRNNNYSEDEGEYVPVTEADIDRIEKKYEIIFPNVLRKYYLDNNAKWIHSVKIYSDDGAEVEINGIIPLINRPLNKHGIKNTYSVECIKDSEINELEEFGYLRIERNFIPLAIDCGGNICRWDSNDGKVYISFNDDEDENGLEIPYYVCSSVEEMFRLMNEAYEKEAKRCGEEE